MFDKRLLVLPLALFMLAGCVQDDESVEPSPNPNDASAVGFKAEFQPLAAIAPFPNDIYVSPTDGTLDLPVVDSSDLGDPLVAMNQLDGFSLNAAIRAEFNDSIDESTLVGGIPGVQAGTVYVFDVTNPASPALLVPGQDYTLGLAEGQSVGQMMLEIRPTHPLAEQSRYAVILTSGIQSTVGDTAEADTVFQQMKASIAAGTTLDNASLEAIKDQQVAPLLQLAAGIGLSSDDVILAWTFSTQSIGESLGVIEAGATAQNIVITAYLGTTNDLAGTGGSTEVYAGMIELPYYLEENNPLTGYWKTAAGTSPTRYNPAPEANGSIVVPLLVTVPPGGGAHDTVIFQHGITQNRTNVLAVADALAASGKAAIAIDLPLHGITDTTSPLYAPEAGGNPIYPDLFGQATEPHLYLDVLDNGTGATGSDGEIDGSGESFINLTSLLTSRDNLRQAASNLIHLVKTVDSGSVGYAPNATGGTAFTLSGASGFVGHSLGGITGGVFLGVNTDVGAATLGMPGGNISQLLQDSPTFAPRINAGLAENGLVQGTQLYYDFFRNAQTVVDAGDPINYAVDANANHSIHMIEVVGGAGNLPDQVVPNSATEALSDTMGLACIDAATAPPTGEGIVRFVAGDHGSLLDPSASMAATTEMQTEMATFLASVGATVWSTTPAAPSVIANCP